MAVRDPLVPADVADSLTPPPAQAIETILGHQFARPALLREALTHRSASPRSGTRRRNAAKHGAGSNERLEFIGDRVLGLLMAEWLAERFPDEQEGGLARRLGHLVSQPVLAGIAADIGLGDAVAVSPGEERVGVKKLATVLADALEATLGALYLDGGLAPARAFVRGAWETAMTMQAEPTKDPKTALQELALAQGPHLPVYTVTARTGPPHAPEFTVTVAAAGRSGTGTASSKRAAETAAAADLLAQLGDTP
jgi:ribonuclease-3